MQNVWFQVPSILSAGEMERCAVRRDIHDCCLSVTSPSLDTWGCLDGFISSYATSPLWSTRWISVKNNSQISCKMPDFMYPLCTENGMLYCTERHPLLMECFIIFLRCIRMIGRASDSVYKLRMVNTTSFLSKIAPKLLAWWHPLSTDNGGWYDTRSKISCCMVVPYPSLDVWGFFEDLLAVSTRPLWSTLCCFRQIQFPNVMQNIRFWAPCSQHRKWDTVLQIQTSIAT